MNFKVLVFILCRFTSICLLHKYMSFFLKGQALKTEVSHKKRLQLTYTLYIIAKN